MIGNNGGSPEQRRSSDSHLDLLGKNELIDIILSLKKEIISLNDDFKKNYQPSHLSY